MFLIRLPALLLCITTLFAKDPLPRRPWLGAQLAPANTEQLAASAQGWSNGVAVQRVIPGSSAEAAGLQEGDVLHKMDDRLLFSSLDITTGLKASAVGKTITFELSRAGKLLTKRVKLKELSRESSDEFEIIYETFTLDGALRRLLLTKPKGVGPFPVVVLMGGIGCYSVDVPQPQPFSYRDILYDFTRNGFATVRIEKTGMGDSQGPPCAAQTFFDEVRGLKAGIQSLDRFAFLDRNQMLYFGHSMGGLSAPVVYRDLPCAGIIAVATSGIDWQEYEMINNRRQLELARIPYDSIEVLLDRHAAAMHEFYVVKRPLDEILRDHPEWQEDLQYPASEQFMRDIADISLASYWKGVASPVLFVYGTADFVTAANEHVWAQSVVNASHPGMADYIEIKGMDHGFNNSGTFQNAFDGTGEPPAVHPDFFPKVLEFARRSLR
ncbi:MAG: PDZ domain-containing protein [bacterium]|nr:PDZ domain-containing protein [bacterium]